MKKIGRFICFTTLFLLIAGCKQQKTIRYELVDGNPQIDYIDFLNDTLCRFVAPGPLVLTSHYTKEGDIYIIQINDIVSARLYKKSDINKFCTVHSLISFHIKNLSVSPPKKQ